MNVMTDQYTGTVRTCLGEIASYLRRVNVGPASVIPAILEHFEIKVGKFPQGCQICPELLKIGCVKYRECNTTDGYRILYSVEERVITAHVVMSQRQDIQQLLFRRLISI